MLVVRHAKSDWTDPSLADHDRPLAPRGIEALARMQDRLATGPRPDLVLCSSARRALDTLAGIRPALPDAVEVEVERALYRADASALLDRLRTLGEDTGAVMIVGHNPALHDLALGLLGDVDGDDGVRDEVARARLAAKFPTGAIAILTLGSRWVDLEPGCAVLDDFFTPRPAR